MSPSKIRWLGILGCAVCVIPPVIAILFCFPVWVDGGGQKTVSGIALLLFVLACLPFIKQIREYLRSPSVVVIWLIICAWLTVIRSIISEVVLVSYVALISNAVGTVVFAIRKKALSETGSPEAKRNPESGNEKK